jgi:tetratricopeptide (TPR) repeat protein
MKENVVMTRADISLESILLDADLFLKYKSPERAVQILHDALERSPRSIALREKLRDICQSQGQIQEAARQCLALASLYINREDFQSAYDRLQEAKLLDPRISIAPGLDAIRRAKHPDFAATPTFTPKKQSPPIEVQRDAVFAGNISLISIFDAIQVIENSKLTGTLTLIDGATTANILFNVGQIVNAEAGGVVGTGAFRQVVEITKGTFECNSGNQQYQSFA